MTFSSPLKVLMEIHTEKGALALATDMAEAELYHFIGGGAGLASLPGEI